MSHEPPDRLDPQETQALAPDTYQPPPPPPPTERIYAPRSSRRPPPSLFALLGLLLLAGVLIGFVIGHFVGRPSGTTRDPNLVSFEPASSTTPYAGAQFTQSTFDPQRGVCDKARLKQFLRADQRRFQAWVQLAGIDAGHFDSFVDRMDTARLTTLSPVTDHGCFDSGDCPFAFQAVLAPGTPVWRDPAQGHIVAKCLSSSPLSAPRCPPNCSGAPASSTTPVQQREQTLPPETPTPPLESPVGVRTPAPVPTVSPF